MARLKTLKPRVMPLAKSSGGGWAATTIKSTTERGYGWAWQQQVERVKERDCGICQPCLRHGMAHSGQDVDHIVPKHRGGSDDDGNLQFICRDAHNAKTAAEKLGRVWDEAAWFAGRARARAG